MENLKVSVVTTLYKSEDYIEDFIGNIRNELKKITSDYEIIFVDDGSPDNSKSVLKKYAANDTKYIKLSKNHGHHRAQYVGLDHAQGDFIFLIDSDLQEDPKYIHDFFNEFKKDANLSCVFGIQNKRPRGMLEKISEQYYKIFNFLSDSVYITPNLMTIRLMKRHYVDEYLKNQDTEIFFPPTFALIGFSTKALKVEKNSKKSSTYTFLKRYHMFLHSIFRFTTKPLYAIFYTGIFITLTSIVLFSIIFLRKLFGVYIVDGWTSVILSLLLLTGILSTFLGFIAIYIKYIFVEVLKRPLYIVEEKIDFKDKDVKSK